MFAEQDEMAALHRPKTPQQLPPRGMGGGEGGRGGGQRREHRRLRDLKMMVIAMDVGK